MYLTYIFNMKELFFVWIFSSYIIFTYIQSKKVTFCYIFLFCYFVLNKAEHTQIFLLFMICGETQHGLLHNYSYSYWIFHAEKYIVNTIYYNSMCTFEVSSLWYRIMSSIYRICLSMQSNMAVRWLLVQNISL